MKLKGSLVSSDREMVEFNTLRAAGRVHSNLTTLDFRKADLVPLVVLFLVEYHGIKTLR